MGLLRRPTLFSFPIFLLFAAAPLTHVGPGAVLWTAPAILVSAILIAWAAESAQFFVAQGFALAILAWLQTAPEFAVEGVIAWQRDIPNLLANLTGALRLLTGLGWPVIYFTAAMFQRKKGGKALGTIQLHFHHSVEVVALMLPLLYMGVVAAKGSLTVWDGLVLVILYAAYLVTLLRLPAEGAESVEDLEAIPRKIVTASPGMRNFLIVGLFVVGGLLIYFSAEPFFESLKAVAAKMGIPEFVFIQWIAPLVSEFPEMASTFYWARTVDKAPMALMNMVSSNINQWTLLTAMLPLILSISAGTITPIVFDDRQKVELLLTLGQAGIGWLFLLNMRLDWWEAAALFVLFLLAFVEHQWAWYITGLYAVWIVFEIGRIAFGGRKPRAFYEFGQVWRKHIRPQAA